MSLSPTAMSKPKQNPTSSCNHSPSATVDLILLLLVLFSSAFLIASSLSHILRSLSLLLPSVLPAPYIAAGILLLLLLVLATPSISGRLWARRRCGRPRCRGLRKSMAFDVKLQAAECLPSDGDTWREIEELPWKGGQQGNNPDYECLRAELRRMAPPNGRAVLLFRSRCGCPVAKLEAWGPKRGRRLKRGITNLVSDGGGR